MTVPTAFAINFPKKSNTLLVKSFVDNDIEIYSHYNCIDKRYSTYVKNYDDFSIDNNTKTI